MNKFSSELLRFNKRLVLNKTENALFSAFYSTKPAVKRDASDDLREKIKQTERITNLYRKPRVKKPQKPPFAKNLFIGKFDVDMLTYPQLEKDELETLQANLKPIADFFEHKDIAATKQFTKEFARDLNDLSLFGLQAPVTVGGRELTYTETYKFNEIISKHALGRNLIFNDLFGIRVLLKNGSDRLKEKYLSRLISGESLATLCVYEDGNYDPKFLRTTARRNSDGSWTLNGLKSLVINGGAADLFIVIAESEPVHKDCIRESLSTAFIVEKKFGGITTQNSNTLLDCDICDVQFNNTLVPAENVVGTEIKGLDVISSILMETRLSAGASCITLMREILSKFTKHCKDVNVGGVNLIETDSALTQIGDLVSTTYAMESMTYLTSLLLDQYENQDCDVEAAIVKVFAAEQTVLSALYAMNFFGASALVKDHWLNQLHREALAHTLLNESLESLKVLIGLLGIQHAGVSLRDHVKELRNPFFYPWQTLKRIWTNRKQASDDPSLNLNLFNHIHPSLREASDMLEYCVLRLQHATETLLIRHGVEVVNDHQNLKRLADCAIDIYAMSACIGRASRSYCIGLRNAEMELLVTIAFCVRARERVQKNVLKIWQGRFNTGDHNKKLLADIVSKSNGYCLEHPLARNF